MIAEALAVSPRDGSLLAELERLAGELDHRQSWRALLDAYEVALAAASPLERVELYVRRARILDERVNDSKGAIADLLNAFSWAPDREDTRDTLVALAGKARAWNDVIAIDTSLVERASTSERRVELLRRKAGVIEEQLKDAPRAFRLHLVALLLAPDDADTQSHLWRLARVIGKYRDTDRTPHPEPPGAPVQADLALADAVATSARPVAGPPTPTTRIPKRLETEPLADSDLQVGDSTQPIDVHELERQAQLASFQTEAATMTLSAGDLRHMAIPPRLPPGAKAPPKPPPRPPQIRRSANPPPAPRKTQVAVRRPPLPSLPNRAFESPWEELATVYEGMPTPDAASRLRWLYRASEVWETGGKDIPRAFDALARAFAQARRSPEGDAEVRGRLHRIAQDHKAWDRLADLYEGMAEEAETAPEAADLLMEVANIRTEQKKPREAEVQLRRILGMLPSDSVSRARLEELYRNEGRWVELSASLEERTDPRLGTAAPEAERPLLLRELAAIYTERLQRPHDAIDALERLRLQAPSDTEVLLLLASTYSAIGRWSKVIETLGRVGEVAEGSAEAREAAHSIGRIYIEELELPERAVETYYQLVTTWPDDATAGPHSTRSMSRRTVARARRRPAPARGADPRTSRARTAPRAPRPGRARPARLARRSCRRAATRAHDRAGRSPARGPAGHRAGQGRP
ncbi:MAG: hypothetical protein WKG01_19885 [Kofleriaceae bacterium]